MVHNWYSVKHCCSANNKKEKAFSQNLKIIENLKWSLKQKKLETKINKKQKLEFGLFCFIYFRQLEKICNFNNVVRYCMRL